MTDKEELAVEVRDAFDKAKAALMYDYMFMGQGVTYLHFKHKDTREYIKIPKCGVAFNDS
jgi:proline dehydrogenase